MFPSNMKVLNSVNKSKLEIRRWFPIAYHCQLNIGGVEVFISVIYLVFSADFYVICLEFVNMAFNKLVSLKLPYEKKSDNDNDDNNNHNKYGCTKNEVFH